MHDRYSTAVHFGRRAAVEMVKMQTRRLLHWEADRWLEKLERFSPEQLSFPNHFQSFGGGARICQPIVHQTKVS